MLECRCLNMPIFEGVLPTNMYDYTLPNSWVSIWGNIQWGILYHKTHLAWDGMKGLKLWRFGKLISTYHGKLQRRSISCTVAIEAIVSMQLYKTTTNKVVPYNFIKQQQIT